MAKPTGLLPFWSGWRALIPLVFAAIVSSACTYQSGQVAPVLPDQALTSRILASDGTLLNVLRAEQNRDLATFDQLAPALIDAVVAIEDERFWQHSGIDVRGILRAAKSNAAAGGIAEGGSTITQQYVKNALLDPTQTINRKLREAVLAVRLEQSYSKEVILEQYLNTIYFGNGAYGAVAASAVYFDKPASELTLAEAALLAGLIRSPSDTNPYADAELSLQRRDLVLSKMRDQGLIEAEAYNAAIVEPLTIAPQFAASERYAAAHFVDEVKAFILNDPRFGQTFEERRDLLFKGGLRITTTIDLEMQAAAERAVIGVLADPVNDPEAAIVAIAPDTGHVLAMVGGRDYFGDAAHAKVNLAVGSGRPAGSTFKPFVLAAALEQGIEPKVRYPAPATLEFPQSAGLEAWEVSNYDKTNGGVVSLTDATVWSYNTVYAQLMYDVGPAVAVDMAARLGVKSPLQAVPAAVLGTENVTVLEMASAYGTFANRGIHVEPVLVTRITTADGAVLYAADPGRTNALTEAHSDELTKVLLEVTTRGTGRAAALEGRSTAGKTGTAENYSDAWFTGYTPQLATAVWVGYPEGQVSMVPPRTAIRVAGGTWPSQIWHDFMTEALAGEPLVVFAHERIEQEAKERS